MGHPIRSFRAARNLTLEGFGRLVGVKKSTVSKWENGHGPSPVGAKKVEEATGGELTKEQLRPDIWPASPEQLE